MFSHWKQLAAANERRGRKRHTRANRRGPKPLRLSFESLDRRLLLSAGALDTSFGTGGVVTLPTASETFADAVAVESNGDVVVGGQQVVSEGTQFWIARYTPSGTLDPTFGSGGQEVIPLGPSGYYQENINALEVLADGNIVATGSAWNSSTPMFATVELNPDGSLDSGFGTGGAVEQPIGAASGANAMALQSGGEILVAGYSYPNGIAIQQYSASGSLDTSFGTSGTVTEQFSEVDPSEAVTGMAVLPDGEIVTVSYAFTGTDDAVHLARFNENGSLDTTFGTNGFTTTYINDGSGTRPTGGILLEPDGGILVAATIDAGTSPVLLGFTSDGSLESTIPVETGSDSALSAPSIAMEGDGKILAAVPNAAQSSFSVARFSATGQLDASFGDSGFATVSTGSFGDSDSSIAIGANGLIAVASGDTLAELVNPPVTTGLTDIVSASPSGGALVDLSAAFSDPTYPDSPLTYSVEADTNPALFSSTSIDEGEGTLTLDYSGTAGTSAITVRATDSGGQYVDTTFNVSLYAGQPSFTAGGNINLSEPSSADGSPVEVADWATNMTAALGDPNPPAFTFQVTQLNGTAGLFAPGAVSIDSQGNLFLSPTPGASGSAAFSVVMQDNGGTVGGRSDVTLVPLDFSVNVNRSAGSLDASFGTAGIVTPLSSFMITAVAAQSNGDIVVAGESYAKQAFEIARYTPAGILDTTFGTGGVEAISMMGGVSAINAIAIQPDGKIIVAGSANNSFATERLNADGSVDATFGTGGEVVQQLTTDSEITSLVLESDGDILVAGDLNSTPDGIGQGIAIQRYTPAGNLDSTFGTDGTVQPSVGTFQSGVIGAAVESNGNIVLLGDGVTSDTEFYDLAALNPDGTVDGAFGTNGVTTTSVGTSSAQPFVGGFAVEPDGEIVVGAANARGVGLDGYTPNGMPDPSFGTDGVASFSLGYTSAPSVIIQGDGEIIAAADVGASTSLRQVSRFSATGKLDTTFGSSGSVQTTLSASVSSTAIVVDPTGDLVVAAGESLVSYLDAPNSTALAAISVAAPQSPTTVALSPAFGDSAYPTSDLTYSIVGDTNPALFSSTPIDDSSGTLTLNYSGVPGTATLTVQATDPSGQSVDTALDVAVYSSQPSFTAGGNESVDEVSNAGASPIEFANWASDLTAAAGDSNTPAFTFQVTQTGGTAGLFAAGAVSIDSQGNLFVSPTEYASGSATFSVVMQDNGGTAGGRSDVTLTPQTFTINVNFVNQPPSFTAGGDETVNENSSLQTITDWATGISPGPASQSGETVAFNVSNNNSQLFSQQPSINSNGTLIFMPAEYASGTATVSVTLQNSGGTANGGNNTSAPQTFTIAINWVNQQPSFTKGTNETVSVNSGAQVNQDWATGISAGAPDESNQILTFTATNTDPALFSSQPVISQNGTLSFTPAPGMTGTATVTATLFDNGGTANGGNNTSASQTFTITISGTTHPLSAVPALSSLPGAPATLYLNFTGDTVNSWGTYSPGVIPAYDQDGDPTTFSDSELESIDEIWTQVANAFSPFNINVTTVPPASMAHGKSMQVDIGGNGSWNGAQPEGGVAYVGGFTNASLPNLAFVFSANQDDGDPKGTADAIEHEAGHMLGLEHQSVYNGTTLEEEYNPGTSASGPIMGAPYNSATARWWDGQSEVSSTTIQNDMAVIADATNGFGYRTDVWNNTLATAATLTNTAGLLTASGVIVQPTDTDYYQLPASGGTYADFTVSPSSFGTTLDFTVELLSSSGQVLSSQTSNLGSVEVNASLPQGTDYLLVEGLGDYGDVGQYSIQGSLSGGPAILSAPNIMVPVNSPHTVINLASVFSLPVGWTSTPSYSVTDTNSAIFDGSLVIDPQNNTLTLAYLPGASGTSTVSLTADDNGAENTATFTVTVSASGEVNLIADPDFSAVAINSGTWQYGPAVSPWTFSGTAGVSGNSSGITAGNPTAPDGSQVGFVQQTGSMSQTVDMLAGSYVLDFLSAQRGNYNFGGQTLQVLVDGSPVGSGITPAGSSYAAYLSASFTVAAGLHTITIEGLDSAGGDNTALVEDVSLVPASQFADPDFAAVTINSGHWQYAPAGSPWTFSGTAGVSANYSGITAANPLAPQGSQVAFVQNTGSMSQTVAMTAGTYTLSFLAAQRENYNHGGQSLEVLVDGVPLSPSITPTGSSYASYTTATFAVTSGTHVITIEGLDPSGADNTALLDAVSIAPVYSSQTADPDFAAVAMNSGHWQYAPAGSPWTFTGTAGVSGNYSAITAGNPLPPSGSQVAFVQETGSLSQTVGMSAGTYTLNFQAAQRENYNFGGQSLEVLVDGSPVSGAITPAGSNYATYASAAFTVTTGLHTITIEGLDPSGGDNTALVDSVSLGPGTLNQVADPDFAAVAQGPGTWQYGPAGSPWTFSGTAGVSGNSSGITAGNPAAPLGSQVAFVQETGSLSQVVGMAAGTYTLDFLAAQREDYNFGGQTLQVSIDGVPVGGSITPTGPDYAAYSSATFTVSAGIHVITITGTNPLGGDNTALVDDVTIAAS